MDGFYDSKSHRAAESGSSRVPISIKDPSISERVPLQFQTLTTNIKAIFSRRFTKIKVPTSAQNNSWSHDGADASLILSKMLDNASYSFTRKK